MEKQTWLNIAGLIFIGLTLVSISYFIGYCNGKDKTDVNIADNTKTNECLADYYLNQAKGWKDLYNQCDKNKDWLIEQSSRWQQLYYMKMNVTTNITITEPPQLEFTDGKRTDTINSTITYS